MSSIACPGAWLLASDQDQRLLEILLERLGERGLVKARGKQRTDSTHVLAAIRTLNRLEFVGETLRAALHALAQSAPAWLARHGRPDWAEWTCLVKVESSSVKDEVSHARTEEALHP